MPDHPEKDFSPELLAPAGSFECLSAAVKAGADSVYFGVGDLNMRSGGAANFTLDEIKEVVSFAHANKVKAYLTLNTIVYDGELEKVRNLCRAAKDADVDACIASDPAVFACLKEADLPAHASVQCNVSNVETLVFYSAFADTVVLARELSLPAVKHIAQEIRERRITGPSGKPVRLEAFAHGALCIALSGKCGMSLCSYGDASANRGRCLQPCRRSYLVKDEETGIEFKIENRFVMSPRDLCTIGMVDKLLSSGVTVLKIEGRARSADYVSVVTRAYREAIDAWKDGSFTPGLAAILRERLKSVFNRGFWEGGYYLGIKADEWCSGEGSLSTCEKTFVGRIIDWYPKAKASSLKIDTSSVRLEAPCRLLVTGKTTGAEYFDVKSFRVNEREASSASSADEDVTFPCEKKVREGDKVYLVTKRDLPCAR